MQTHQSMPAAARWLGLAGVLPFAATAINLHTAWPLFNGFALQIFIVYSAVILSFLGGIRWGLAVNAQAARSADFVLAVLPSLVATGAVLLPRPGWQILALAAGFAAIGTLDFIRPAAGMKAWLRSLRWQLSLLVLITHGMAWLAVRSW